MTEVEWLACTQPQPMLAYLRGQNFSIARPGRRKLRLFGCACCRRIWQLLDPTAREWIKWAEAVVDGAPTSPVCPGNPGLWKLQLGPNHPSNAGDLARLAAYQTVQPSIRVAAGAGKAAASAVQMEAWQTRPDKAASRRAEASERAAQANLLRDIVDVPFHGQYVEPSWLTWNDEMVRKLARVMYDTRCFDRMASLTDALTYAGCTDIDILSHCREPGEHVRGCWVVDLLLGKS